MEIYFTIDASFEVVGKISAIVPYEDKIDHFFQDRFYSNDLEVLYVGLCCMNPTFDPFFATRRPKYTPEYKKYLYKGVELEKKAKTYEYELRLDFQRYHQLDDIRKQFSEDVVNSLDNILVCKKIRQVDLQRFKDDFRELFNSIGWG